MLALKDHLGGVGQTGGPKGCLQTCSAYMDVNFVLKSWLD